LQSPNLPAALASFGTSVQKWKVWINTFAAYKFRYYQYYVDLFRSVKNQFVQERREIYQNDS
jgi:hypothetical protein